MAKIIRMPGVEQTVGEFMEQSARIFGDEGVTSVVVAGRTKEGQWVTGYLEADWATRNEALGHIQADIIDQMILANLERYR